MHTKRTVLFPVSRMLVGDEWSGDEEKRQLWVTFQSIGAACLAEYKVTSATHEARLQHECHSRLNHQERPILSSLPSFLIEGKAGREASTCCFRYTGK